MLQERNFEGTGPGCPYVPRDKLVGRENNQPGWEGSFCGNSGEKEGVSSLEKGAGKSGSV